MSGIEYMYKLFGKSPDGLSCKDCEHFMTVQANRRYFKCAVYGNTDSAASDWRKKYTACGMYNKVYNGTPVIEAKKHDRKPKDDIVIDGQMSLFGEGWGLREIRLQKTLSGECKRAVIEDQL